MPVVPTMIALLVAPTLGLSAPAPATVTGPSAQDTVNSLKGQGNRVIVNKVGNGPLSQCTVSGVRRGHEVRSLPPRIFHRAPNYSTVYVDVVCG